MFGKKGEQSGRQFALQTVVQLLLAGLVLPMVLGQVSRRSDDRRKGLDLQVRLIGDLTSNLTATVIQADFFASHLVAATMPSASSAVASTPYSQALGTWLTSSSQLGSELNTYFHVVEPCPKDLDRIFDVSKKQAAQCGWLPIFAAVTDYLRLSTNAESSFNRREAVDRLRALVKKLQPLQTSVVDWDRLLTPDTQQFYAVFRQTQNLILSIRDLYIEYIRQSHLLGTDKLWPW